MCQELSLCLNTGGSRDRKIPAAYWPESPSAIGLNERLCMIEISFAL